MRAWVVAACMVVAACKSSSKAPPLDVPEVPGKLMPEPNGPLIVITPETDPAAVTLLNADVPRLAFAKATPWRVMQAVIEQIHRPYAIEARGPAGVGIIPMEPGEPDGAIQVFTLTGHEVWNGVHRADDVVAALEEARGHGNQLGLQIDLDTTAAEIVPLLALVRERFSFVYFIGAENLKDAMAAICDAAVSSDSAHANPAERQQVITRWIHDHVENRAALAMYTALGDAPPEQRARILTEAARNAGLDHCALADDLSTGPPLASVAIELRPPPDGITVQIASDGYVIGGMPIAKADLADLLKQAAPGTLLLQPAPTTTWDEVHAALEVAGAAGRSAVLEMKGSRGIGAVEIHSAADAKKTLYMRPDGAILKTDAAESAAILGDVSKLPADLGTTLRLAAPGDLPFATAAPWIAAAATRAALTI